MATEVFTVSGMTCDHCAGAVRSELAALDGVTRVDVDLTSGAVTVESAAALDRGAVAAAVDEAGYALADGRPGPAPGAAQPVAPPGARRPGPPGGGPVP